MIATGKASFRSIQFNLSNKIDNDTVCIHFLNKQQTYKLLSAIIKVDFTIINYFIIDEFDCFFYTRSVNIMTGIQYLFKI